MKSRYLSRVAIILLCLGAVANAPANGKDSFGTLVRIQQGQAQGQVIEDFDTVAWKGLPYAKPPVGDLRWQPPLEAESWDGVRDATEYGSRCFQGSGGDEDCLYLNVWRPDTRQMNLPVFVYIHGGSNVGGSGEGSWYTVAHHYNAVVVTLNYRLGPMGWFLHPALMTGDPKTDSGNFGTLDQIKALEWVEENIERFGGNRKNLTLAGASAGAQNVSYLMHSHLAEGLFHKAILESNFPGIRPVSAAFKSSKQVLYNLLVKDGLAPDTVSAKMLADSMTNDAIKEYFHEKSAEEIRESYRNAWWGGINWGDFYRDDIIAGSDFVPPPLVQASEDRPEFVYVIGDGYVLPDDIDFADFSEGRVFPRPMIVGTTKNENNFWNAWWPFNYQWNKSLDTLVSEAVDGTNPDYAYLQEFFDRFGEGDPETFKQNYKFGTELIDEVDTYLGAHLSARNMAAIKTRPKVDVYVYRFDWGSDPNKTYKIPSEDAWVFYLGAIHVAESDFFYQKFGLTGGDSVEGKYEYTDDNLKGRKALSLAIKSYLYEFIHDKNGKINKQKNQPVGWKPWTKEKEQFIIFDADHASADVFMTESGIARTPSELHQAHLVHPNDTVRDFIQYYIMWSWHWNWYPNASVGPFDTSPGPNIVFDPDHP